MNNNITLTAEQWAEITENNNYPCFLTLNQQHVIEKTLFAFNIDGDIKDLDNDILSIGINLSDLGQE